MTLFRVNVNVMFSKFLFKYDIQNMYIIIMTNIMYIPLWNMSQYIRMCYDEYVYMKYQSCKISYLFILLTCMKRDHCKQVISNVRFYKHFKLQI